MEADQKANVASVRRQLDLVEPGTTILSCFDREQIPLLYNLYDKPTGSSDLERYRLSARALYVLSWLMRPEELIPVLQKASNSARPAIRRTAAEGAARLPRNAAVELFSRLLSDEEASVVRVTAQSIPRALLAELREAIIKARDKAVPDSYLRTVLDRILKTLPKGKAGSVTQLS